MHKPKRVMPNNNSRRSRGRSGSPLLSAVFFPAAVLYHELLARLFDQDNPFFTMALPRLLFFSAAAGLLIFLILDLLPWKGVSLWISLGLVLLASLASVLYSYVFYRKKHG